MTATHVHSTIDFGRPGKQHGHLGIPYQDEAGRWTTLLVPMATLAGATGPTALVMAGRDARSHAGQVAILRLMQALEPSQMAGRLILIPELNLPPEPASARVPPAISKRVRRATPEPDDGAPAERVFHFFASVLFPLVDVVVDIHSAEGQLDFHPCMLVRLVDDPAQRQETIEAALAWNTDFAFLQSDGAGNPLSVEAERQGKIVVTAEMGASDPVSAAQHKLVQYGLANVLAHFGMIAGTSLTRSQRSMRPTRWLEAGSQDDYRFAPEGGLYENLVARGCDVEAGAAVGQIHFLQQPEREPQLVVAGSEGVLLATRSTGNVLQGDCVACIAREVELDWQEE